MSKQFIEALGHRIESFLPNRTGYTIAEVELNPQFLATRKILLSSDPDQFSEHIFTTFCGILNQINLEADGIEVSERSCNSISSTLIVLKLLFEYINHQWLLRGSPHHSNNIIDRPFNFSSYFHYEIPKRMSKEMVDPCILTLISLLSNRMLTNTLQLVKISTASSQNMPYTTNNQQSQLNVSLTSSNIPDPDKSIQDIDKYVSILLKFLAVSNPYNYYMFLRNRIFAYSRTTQYVPNSVIHKFSPLFEFMYYNETVSIDFAKDMTGLLPFIKSTTLRNVVLVFLANSIRDQCFSRPEDYTRLIRARSEMENCCRILFDLVFSVVEGNFSNWFGIGSSVLSWLTILCVSDYEEFLTKPNKLKLTFNKRLKFLTQIVRESKEQSSLGAYDSLINIFSFAARQGDPTHPIYQFTLENLDSTIDSLAQLHVTFNSKDALNLFDNILISMNVVSIMIKPERYIPIFVRKFQSQNNNLQEMKVLVKTMKGLSELNDDQVEFEGLVKILYFDLKNLINNASKILCEETGPLGCRYSHTSNSNTTAKKDVTSPTNSKFNFSDEADDQTTNKSINDNSSNSTSSTKQKLIIKTEEVLSDLLYIFIKAPKAYFLGMEIDIKDADFCSKLKDNSYLTTLPLKTAFQSNNQNLVDAASSLVMALVSLEPPLNDLANLTMCTASVYVIHHISEICLQTSLTDPKFKQYFLFLTNLLEKRVALIKNDSFLDSKTRVPLCEVKKFGKLICLSLEKILLLSLCTHDIQFYTISKNLMSWYVTEIDSMGKYYEGCYNIDLYNKFMKIMNDDSIFTGFVSLHKKFRILMRDFEPSPDIFEVWQIIYERWTDMLEYRNVLDDENLVFRHYTGFLISMSGSFLLTNEKQYYTSTQFTSNTTSLSNDLVSQNNLQNKNNQISVEYKDILVFFDKCIHLLTERDLVIRVIVKDALSNEDHPAVYHLICTKLVDIIKNYVLDDNISNVAEKILFLEQVIAVMTCMLGIKSDGSFVLGTLCPTICETINKFIYKRDDTSMLKLKIRMCKFYIAIESDKSRIAVHGSLKVRNHFAKSLIEWLKNSVYYEENGNFTTEETYLMIDLANESSKALSLLLENLPLEIPDETRDSDVEKMKEASFTNYFSIFFKILQRYTQGETLVKSKYKIHLVIDNVLKCISNLLQTETEVGIQFVLPLSFHENPKIRSIFINVFADIFVKRNHSNTRSEFPDNIYEDLSEFVDLCGTAAQVASTGEYNLLASSLFSIFSYTKRLDELIHTLLHDEVIMVTKPTEIFRRNSTLTRILSNFGKEYGLVYLKQTLAPVLQEMAEKEVMFEVEKDNCELGDSDVNEFIYNFSKLIEAIKKSVEFAPPSIRFISREVYNCAASRNPEEAVITVGSYLFLRFICPAIVNPDVFLGISITSPKIKRSFMQLGKVVQNMANGTLTSLKWTKLQDKADVLNSFNDEIFSYLKEMSGPDTYQGYPFQEVKVEEPVAELRYLHKFFYWYIENIRHDYIFGESLGSDKLAKRVKRYRKFDSLIATLGLPKSSLALQIKTTLKTNVSNNPHFADLIGKLAIKFNDSKLLDIPIVSTSINSDGTPTVVMNLRKFAKINNDLQLLAYRFFDICSQVWDNNFYLVYDFSEAEIAIEDYEAFVSLLKIYGPDELFNNCTKVFYFAPSLFNYKDAIVAIDAMLQGQRVPAKFKAAIYSHCDGVEIANSIGLSQETLSTFSDVRVEFHDVWMWDLELGQFFKVVLKMGRKWISICAENKIPFSHPRLETDGFHVSLIRQISSISKCEASTSDNEFAIHLEPGKIILMKSERRAEILRFLYFSTSRLARELYTEDTAKYAGSGKSKLLWFSRLYQTVFQGLLCDNAEVKSAAGHLFAALSHYYELGLGISYEHAKNTAFPANTTDFIVSTSSYLAKNKPEFSYRFFKAFFDYYNKLPESLHVSAIMYISPWIDNICDFIYLCDRTKGPSRTVDIIRQFCRISSMDRSNIPVINDYVWKKMFSDTRLTSVLIEEVVAYAIDARNSDVNDWHYIIAIVTPSLEVCGEVITRLHAAVQSSTTDSSVIVAQSKIVEIIVLVRIASAIFFDSYTYSVQYVPDLCYFCTLFVSQKNLDIGIDLQQWCINAVQSFLHKPKLTAIELESINKTLSYLSGQRAHLLFDTRREPVNALDTNQIYARATSLEVLCDDLHQFLTIMGSESDLITCWRSRWCDKAIDTAFRNNSVFQSRSILIVGILSKVGISDYLASKVLKLVSRLELKALTYLTSLAISIARLFEGLSPKSTLINYLIWPLLGLAKIDNIVLYQPTAHCLMNILLKWYSTMDSSSQLVEAAFEKKKYLEPYITNFENSHGIKFTRDNLQFQIFLVFIRGIRVSQVKHTSLNCMKKICAARLRYGGNVKNSGAIPYITFIYLCSNDAQFESFCQEAGVDIVTDGEFPSFILNYFKEGSLTAEVTLILAAMFYKSDSMDGVFNYRFLKLFNIISERYKEVGYLVFNIVSEALQKTLSNSNNVEIIEMASNLLLSKAQDENYDMEKYDKLVQIKLDQVQFPADKEKFLSFGDYEFDMEKSINSDVKTLSEVMYRAACSYVEGQNLED